MGSPLRGAMLSPSMLCTPHGSPCPGRMSLSSPLPSSYLLTTPQKSPGVGRNILMQGNNHSSLPNSPRTRVIYPSPLLSSVLVASLASLPQSPTGGTFPTPPPPLLLPLSPKIPPRHSKSKTGWMVKDFDKIQLLHQFWNGFESKNIIYINQPYLGGW